MKAFLILAAVFCFGSFAASPSGQPCHQVFNGKSRKYRMGTVNFDLQDYKGALRLLYPLAERGYAPAQYALGLMYEKGKGLEKDYNQAVRWYEKAAWQGHPLAQLNLGFLWHIDQGVTKDNTGLSHGYALQALPLSIIRFKMNKNQAVAAYWYKRAAKQGVNEAQYNLNLIMDQIGHDTIPEQEKKAAEQRKPIRPLSLW